MMLDCYQRINEPFRLHCMQSAVIHTLMVVRNMEFIKYIRLNHNKGSKSVPLLMKNQLSYTPFILLPQVYIAFHSTFPKISDIQLLSFIFYTTLKLLPTWLSQTLQICERSYFMLKIVAKTPRISLYFSYLHI